MFTVTSQDEIIIAAITCGALQAAVNAKKFPAASHYQPLSFNDHNGVFVTLHSGDRLRGCIGLLDSSIPFIEALIESAKNAATEDYRFDPVAPDELPDLSIEVTILSPTKRIHSEDEVVIGVHGLIIEHRGLRGLLLPQVATERRWMLCSFLMHSVIKQAFRQVPGAIHKRDCIPSVAAIFPFLSETLWMQGDGMIREPAVSGYFYPSDAVRLVKDVQGYINFHPVRKAPGKLIGIVAPHAGYMYSGLTAGAAYALLVSQKYETAVIIAPNHQLPFRGISIYNGDAYRSPLGLSSVDTELRNRIQSVSDLVVLSEKGHQQEHAVEVQIPFLQHVQPGIKVVPIVIGERSLTSCSDFGKALATVLDTDRHILIASSDLSHFHTEQQASTLDKRAADAIQQLNVHQFINLLSTGQSEACGGGPIAAVMTASKLLGCTEASILHQSTSGDVSGDHANVVGYLSAAFWKTELRET
jgi:MEMO1 family protein